VFPTSSKLVCIVDDDPFVRAATSSLVRSFGWEAREFESAVAFLSSDAAGRTSCLVSDVQMPGMDGLELLVRLKQGGVPPRTLFMSAFVSDRLRERVESEGALCLIEKPVDAGELASWIGRALEFS
jgi:FixJ family two-component response regulator